VLRNLAPVVVLHLRQQVPILPIHPLEMKSTAVLVSA
jgi:hypothetical protein